MMTDTGEDIDLSMDAIHLSEEEASQVIITVSDELGRMHSNCFIGKILATREQDVRSVRTALRQAWGCNFNLIRLQQNVFQIVFEHQQDSARVYANRPWCFAQALISLQRWVEDWETRSDFFAFSEFWIHVVDLPFHLYTEEVGKQVVVALKATTGCQLREEQPSGKRFFRFRISVDLRRSLCRFVTLLINGVKLQGKLQFERLPHIGGQCGMWNHTVSACKAVSRELSVEERRRLPYGEAQVLKAQRRSTLVREFQPTHISAQREKSYLIKTMALEVEKVHGLVQCGHRNRDEQPIILTSEGIGIGALPYGEVHDLNRLCRITLGKGIGPESQSSNSSTSATITSIVPHIESVRIAGGFVSNSDSAPNENGTGSAQLVDNLSYEIPPMLTNMLMQLTRPMGHFNGDVSGQPNSGIGLSFVTNLFHHFIQHSMGNSHGLIGTEQSYLNGGVFLSGDIQHGFTVTDFGVSGSAAMQSKNQLVPIVAENVESGWHGRRIQVTRGARYRDISMPNGGARSNNINNHNNKRKAEAVVDGESSVKKNRLLISEPLAESAELQARPAP